MSRAHFSLLLILLSAVALAGCASRQTLQTPTHGMKSTASPPVYKGKLSTRLDAYLQSWRGTPYQYGGLSKRGIDCSGFVYVAYRDVFKRKLGRSTELQARAGRKIPQGKLKFGDLVFFKTGFRQRHVGIYIGQGKFIHASSSRGVTTSRLKSGYWASHYWKSIRPK